MITVKKIFPIVSVLVCSLLLCTMLYSQGCSSEKAFEVKAEYDLKKIYSELKSYKSDNGSFPKNLEKLKGQSLTKTLSDPWGNKYQYSSNGNKALVFTYGNPKNPKFIYHVEENKI